jgi:Tfp pilus assembly protein PilO
VDKNRIWMIGTVLVMVAVVALGLLLGIQPQLAAIATADDARGAVETTNAGQAAVLAKLQADFAGIDTLKADLAPLEASVPSGTQMPRFVNQLNALAGSTAVTLIGITVADAAPYVEPTALAATGTGVAAAPPVTNALITANNFASLAVHITVTGSFDHALDFVSGLQSGERLFLVTGLTTTKVAPDPAAKKGASTDVSAGIDGFVYVLVPPTSAAAPAATPAPTPAP